MHANSGNRDSLHGVTASEKAVLLLKALTFRISCAPISAIILAIISSHAQRQPRGRRQSHPCTQRKTPRHLSESSSPPQQECHVCRAFGRLLRGFCPRSPQHLNIPLAFECVNPSCTYLVPKPFDSQCSTGRERYDPQNVRRGCLDVQSHP